MTTTDPRHYDVISVAGHHREGDHRVGAQPGRLQGRQRRDQAADQGSGREALRRQGQERQYPHPQGQGEGFARQRRRAVAHQAAIVTLQEGHKIDVTTGL